MFLPNLAFAWDNYIKSVVVGNNRLLGEKEGDRFIKTIIDFESRSRENRACDPRKINSLYPNRELKIPRSCRFSFNKSSRPAPTNAQFKTLWNPYTYKYKSGYLTGPKSNERKVRLGLFRKQKGGWTTEAGFSCNWSINGEIEFLNVPCRRLDTELKVGKYEADIEILKNGKPFLPTETFMFEVRDITIVALGDSFGSGEGNPHAYVTKFKKFSGPNPGLWLDPRCHRSLLSSSGLATALLADRHRGVSFNLINTACSGAETTFGLMKPYKGKISSKQVARLWRTWAKNKKPKLEERYFGYKQQDVINPPKAKKSSPAPLDIPPQIDQMAEALGCIAGKVCNAPDAILLYMGVNDIAFSNQLANLIFKCLKDTSCEEEQLQLVKSGIEQIVENLGQFNSAIKARKLAPLNSEQVYLIGYPNPLTRPAKNGKGFRFCNSKDIIGSDGAAAFLDINIFGLGITENEASWAQENILKPLNKTLDKFATNNGWTFVDLENDMLGHGFCAKNRYFNTHRDSRKKQGVEVKEYYVLTNECDPTIASNNNCLNNIGESRKVSSGTMHPNYFGHRQVAAKIIGMLEQDLDLN